MVRLPKVHYVKPETVETGDLIRVTVKDRDVEVAVLGRIHDMQYEGSDRVYYTRAGLELLRWNPHYRFQGRVTLVERMPVAQPVLDFAGDWG
jgi:hypothetical protein